MNNMAKYFRALVLVFSSVAWANQCCGQDVSDLWTRNEHIRVARFHVALIYAFSKDQVAATQKRLADVFQEFNGDVRALSRDPRFQNFQIQREVEFPVSNAAEFESALQKLEENVQEASQLHLDDTHNKLPNDVVFVYVLSHGIQDDSGHVKFQIATNATFDRDTLERRLESLYTRNLARFVVLMTDNCTAPMTDQNHPKSVPIDKSGIWRALYFGHKGFVHLSSASADKNQLAFLSDGSLFVNALGNALLPNSIAEDHPGITSSPFEQQIEILISQLDTDEGNGKHDGVVTWAKFVAHMQRQLTKQFDLALNAAPSDSLIAKQKGQELVLLDHSEILQPSD
jgi:hypothetical protein